MGYGMMIVVKYTFICVHKNEKEVTYNFCLAILYFEPMCLHLGTCQTDMNQTSVWHYPICFGRTYASIP